MEIAIFLEDEFVRPDQMRIIREFNRYRELLDCYGDDCVGASVPISLIQDLINYLRVNINKN